LWTAFGPRSLALGGRVFDAVVPHTFFSDETLARCVAAVKRAAEEAGRDRERSRLVVLRDGRQHPRSAPF
jgi:alkanesulfonate monooxygenase SsuD/methylene tetrahydromethanopterin reductase-like flavin-dependent oxidoreductase (luciferase family)